MTTANLGFETPTSVDRRDRDGYYFGTTNPYWHDQLRNLFDHIDASGIPYCVLHGYDGYDGVESGDIDCVVHGADLPRRFGAALRHAAAIEGFRLVNWYNRSQDAHVFVLAKRTAGAFQFFWLDVLYADFEGHWKFFEGDEMLRERRRVNGFWAPAPEVEFAAYVATKATKLNLTDAHASRLTALFRQAPAECERTLARFFGPTSVQLILDAARSDDWTYVRSRLQSLRSETLAFGRRRALRQPLATAAYFAGEASRWLARLGARTGLHLWLYGDDSTSQNLARDVARTLAPAFRMVDLDATPVGRPGMLQRVRSAIRQRWQLSRTALLISRASGRNPNNRVLVPVDLAFTARDAVDGAASRSQVSEVAAAVIELMEQRTARRLRLQ